jgi:hypothetical protein
MEKMIASLKYTSFQIGSRTLNGLSQLEVLHLEDNLLTEVTDDQLTNLTLLRHTPPTPLASSELKNKEIDSSFCLSVLFS